MLELAAAVGLVSWFAGCAAANLLPRRAWIRRNSLSWLLPEWRFFAPNPATHDYELFYRHRSFYGHPAPAVVVRFPPRRIGNFLLNPISRSRKATRDAIEELLHSARVLVGVPASAQERGSAPGRLNGQSAGYAALLRETARLAPRGDEPTYVQFGVRLVEGTEPPKLLFVSRWEPVE